MMKFLTRTFVKGLVVLLPIVAGVYVLFWIVGEIESAVRGLLTRVLPEGWYVPGMGVAVTIAIVFIVGLLMYPLLTRKLLHWLDGLLRRIPIFSTVYGPLRDLMDMVGGDIETRLGQPVMVTVPNTNMQTLGFITRRDGAGMPDGLVPRGHVVVYVQWSSQIGGYCFIVPRDAVREINMSVEQAMRWSLTAGVSAPRSTATAPAEEGKPAAASDAQASSDPAESAGPVSNRQENFDSKKGAPDESSFQDDRRTGSGDEGPARQGRGEGRPGQGTVA